MKKQSTDNISLSYSLGRKNLFRVAWHVLRHDLNAEEILSDAAPQERLFYTMSSGLDGIVTRQLPTKGRRTLIEEGHFLAYVVERRWWNCVVLKGDFQDYLANRFSPKSLESLTREEARFVQPSGKLDLREYRTEAELQTLSELMSGISQGARDGLGVTAGVRGYVLFREDVAAAYLIMKVSGDTLVWLGSGEREGLEFSSADAVLHLAVIRRLLEQTEYRYFELPPGDGQSKNPYATTAVRCCDVLWVRNTLMNRLLLGTHRSLVRASGWLNGKGRSSRVGRGFLGLAPLGAGEQ